MPLVHASRPLGCLILLLALACGRTAALGIYPDLASASGGSESSLGTGAAAGSTSSSGGVSATGGTPSTGGVVKTGGATGTPDPPNPGFIDASECDVIVPDDIATFDEAMYAAPQPGQICLRPGVYRGSKYPALNIKDGVRVAGLGPEKPILCERVDASAAFVLGTGFRDVVVANNIHAQTPVSLTADRVDFQTVIGCAPELTEHSIHIFFQDPVPSLDLEVRDCRFGSNAVFVQPMFDMIPQVLHIRIRRSSCLAEECFGFLELNFGKRASGSLLELVLENNIISRGVLAPIQIEGSFLDANDAAASSVEISSNTLLAPEGEKTAAIAFGGAPSYPILLDNNAIGNFGKAVEGASYSGSGNVVAENDADAWFVNPELSDLRPAANSALRDAANAASLPLEDYSNEARVSADVGALEYRP